MMRAAASLALALALAPAPGRTLAQAAPADTLDAAHVAAVDVFGLRTVRESAVRAAVGLSRGDPLPESGDSIRARLRAIPGVADVSLSLVCCADRTGGALVYVGVREAGTPAPVRRPAPTGAARLPDSVFALGDAFSAALDSATRRGSVAENDSAGYALAADPAMRALQQRFLAVARSGFGTLRTVLRTSASPEHRAFAAQLLAYGSDRRAVAAALTAAVDDPDETVRNNAIRTLALLAAWAQRHPRAGVRVPCEPFLSLVDSPVWTDRNKGTLALMPLTESRDSALLARLRARSLPSLVEMARWTNPGHALAAYLILARVVGVSDEEALRAWRAGDRTPVLARAEALKPH